MSDNGTVRSVAKTQQRNRSTVFVHGQKVYLTSRNDLTMNKRQRYRRRVCGGKRVRGVNVVRHLADDGTRAGHQRPSRFLIRVLYPVPSDGEREIDNCHHVAFARKRYQNQILAIFELQPIISSSFIDLITSSQF